MPAINAGAKGDLLARWIDPFLRPVMKAKSQAAHEPTAVSRPEQSGQVQSGGADPDRVLLFGNGPAAGWGVASHDAAIPGHLAREFSALTGHPVEVNVIADPAVGCAAAPALLAGLDLSAYDAVVVILGSSDALQLLPTHRWELAMTAVIRTLLDKTAVATDIVIMGIQPLSSIPAFSVRPNGLADEHASILNEITRQACRGRVTYLEPPDVRHPGLALTPGPASEGHWNAVYHEWGKIQAGRLQQLRAANPAWRSD